MTNDELSALQETVEELEERVSRLEAKFEENPEVVDEAMDIQTFVDEFNPDTHVERALAIGYYLEEHDGKDSFTSADIEEGYKRARIPLPANMSDVLGDCEDRGWMMRAGQQGQAQLRQLTTDGLNHVNEVIDDGS